MRTEFVNSSLALSIPIKIDGTLIATSYNAGDPMNNPAAGFGICRFTVYASDGTVAKSNNVSMQDISAYRDSVKSGIGDAVINFGFQAADTITIVPVYGVRDAGGNLDWRKLDKITIQIVALANDGGAALNPNVTI